MGVPQKYLVNAAAEADDDLLSRVSRYVSKAHERSFLKAEAVIDTRLGLLTGINLSPILHGHFGSWTPDLLAQAAAFTSVFDAQHKSRLRFSLALGNEQACDPQFNAMFKSTLAASQLSPVDREVSFLETELAESCETARNTDRNYSGINLAIREFGEGSAALRPFEVLDVSSVHITPRLTENLSPPLKRPHYAAGIVSCLVDLSQLLDFEVVACGVHSSEQAWLLQGLGCTLQQGPYYTPPIILSATDPQHPLKEVWLGLT